jgi:hypothetical protein
VVDVLRQRVEAEILRDAVLAPGLGDRLEEADEQLSGVLLVVGPFVAEEHDREIARQVRDRLGDDVEMFRRVERNGDADSAARSRDHMPPQMTTVRASIRPCSVITPTAAVLDDDLGNRQVLDDARAAVRRPWHRPW